MMQQCISAWSGQQSQTNLLGSGHKGVKNGCLPQGRDSGAGSDRQKGVPRSDCLKLHGQLETSCVICLWAIIDQGKICQGTESGTQSGRF